MANDLLTVSYSKIKAWRFCRQSYYYKFVEKIIPKRKPRPLRMGSLVHEVLELLAKNKDWKPVIDRARKEYGKLFQEEKEYYGDFASETERIISGYKRKYAKEPFKFFFPETTFGPIPLTDLTAFKFKIDKLAQPLSGQMKNNLFLMETKTGKRIPRDEMRIWDLQTAIYIWGLRETGKDIKGIIWDYVRTKAPTIPQLLKNGELSQRQNIDTDYFTYYQAIKDSGLNPSDYKEFLEMLKEKEDEFYKRIMVPISNTIINSVVQDAKTTSLEIYYLTDCPVKSISGYTCPRCDYSSICYAQLRGLDEAFIREKEYMIKPPKEDETDVIETEEESSD